MTTRIRLTRVGRKKLAIYKVVVADSRSPRDGKFIAKIGTYQPHLAKDDKNRFIIDKEKVEYWLKVGAIPSERVAKFLCELGIEGAQKHKPVFIPKEKKKVEPKKEEKAVEAPAEEKPADDAPKAEAKSEEPVAEEKATESEAKAEEKPAEEAPKAEEKAEAPKEETKTEEKAEKAQESESKDEAAAS